MDRELSAVYSRFCDEQQMKKKFNRQRPLKARKGKKNAKKKDFQDFTNFREYIEYLDMFADKGCFLHDDLKPKPGANAKIFKEALEEARAKSVSPRSRLNSPPAAKTPSMDKTSAQFRDSIKEGSSKEKSALDSRNQSNNHSRVDLLRESSIMFQEPAKENSVVHKQSYNFYSRSNSRNIDQSYAPSAFTRKNSPAATQTGGIGTYLSLKHSAKDAVEFTRLPLLKTKFLVDPSVVMTDSNIITLKEKISRNNQVKPRAAKREAKFQFDKNFIASRKLQEKNHEFNTRNGLVPRSQQGNLSFGL